jgi:uncharacterized membrane protein
MFEFFFKYPPEVFSKASFVLLGSWPRWLLVLFILIAAGALAYSLWRDLRRQPPVSAAGTDSRPVRWRTAGVWILQTALASLILFLLWQPALSIAALKPQQNIVAVVIDDSRSMSVADSGTTRIEAAKRVIKDSLINELSQRFQVRLYRLDATLARISDKHAGSLAANAPATHIGAGLDQLAREASTLPIGAIVLLSDGGDNSGGIGRDTIAQLRARRLPVNTIGFGNPRMEKDIEIEAFDVPAKALSRSRLEARVSLRQQGFNGAAATLTVLAGGVVAGSRQIKFSSSGAQTETVGFDAGAAGVKNLEARIDPLPGETNTGNNRLTQTILVDDSKRRILYIEGEPRWDYKFLRRAVEDDPVAQVASLLRTTQNKIYRQGIASPEDLAQGFPNRPEELFSYQALILGSIETAFFTITQQEIIKQFVDRRGGGILFLGGPASLAEGGYGAPPFAELLPVVLPSRKGTFQRDMVEAVLTEAGKQSLICRVEDDPQRNLDHWKNFPLLANYQDAGTAKPGATVLAEMNVANKRLPLLVLENYGRGRSAVLASGGLWRWKMQQPKEDTSQPMFWRQLLRWLVGATPGHVVASTSNPLLDDDGHVELRAEVRNLVYSPASDAEVEARVVLPDGGSETVALRPDPLEEGIYSAAFDAAHAGSYVAEIHARRGSDDLGSDSVAFRRENGMAENFHREQNRELLERLAEETGGRYYQPEDARHLPVNIAYSEAGITERETKDLWDMPVVFLAAIGLRATEWLLRRRWGAI